MGKRLARQTGRWTGWWACVLVGAAACGQRGTGGAGAVLDADPAELVSAAERQAAALSFLSVIDVSEVYLGVAQTTDPTLDRLKPTQLGTFGQQRGRCVYLALKNKVGQAAADTSAWLPASSADGSLIESVMTMTFDPLACSFFGRALSGSQQLAVVKNGTQADRREIFAQPQLTFALTDGSRLQLVSASPQRPGLHIEAPAAPSLQPQALTLAFDLTAHLQPADGQAQDLSVSCQDSNAVLVQQRYGQLGAEQLRDASVGSQVQATVDVGLTLQTGRVVVAGLAGGGIAEHTYEQAVAELADGCRCPSSGRMTQRATYQDGHVALHRFEFIACGQAKVSSQVSTATTPAVLDTGTVVWAECGG